MKNWLLLIDLFKVKNKILHYDVHGEENDRQWKEWNSVRQAVILKKIHFFPNCYTKNVHIV